MMILILTIFEKQYRIWSDTSKKEVNQYYISTSFPELPGGQNNQSHFHELRIVSWGMENLIITRFARAFMTHCYMRMSLDILSPLSVHLSISFQYHVYLAFIMPYKVKKYSSHFENRGKGRWKILPKCELIFALFNLWKSGTESNQKVKPNWLRRNTLDGPVRSTGGWYIHPVRNHRNVFLVRSGNSVSFEGIF